MVKMRNLQQILDKLKYKHVIICGGDRDDRLNLANQVVSEVAKCDSEVFRLPEGLGNRSDYITACQAQFPIESPLGIAKEQMTHVQLDDVLLDWVEKRNRTIVFWPEMQLANQNDSLGPMEVLSDFVTEKFILEDTTMWNTDQWFRLVCSTEELSDSIFNNMKIFIGRGDDDMRTEEEISRTHLGIVRLT
jgi:hypothetical protein